MFVMNGNKHGTYVTLDTFRRDTNGYIYIYIYMDIFQEIIRKLNSRIEIV